MKNDKAYMNETPLFEPPKKDPHLLDFFTLLAKRRWLVGSVTFGCVLHATGASTTGFPTNARSFTFT